MSYPPYTPLPIPPPYTPLEVGSLAIPGYIFAIENDKLPHHYFDMVQHMGGIPEISYMTASSATFASLIIILLINNANDYTWFNIFKALSGSQSFSSIEIKDKHTIDLLVKRAKLVMHIIKIYFHNIWLFLVFFTGSCLLIGYDIRLLSELVYGLVAIVLFLFIFMPVLTVLAYSYAYFYIVSFFCRLRFQEFNARILTMVGKEFVNIKIVKEMFEEHNQICKQLSVLNSFWSKYIMTFYYSFLPCVLLLAQMVFFQYNHLNTVSYIFVVILSLYFSTTLSITNLIIASVNVESSKTFRILYKLLLKDGQYFSINLKFRVSFLRIEGDEYIISLDPPPPTPSLRPLL